MEKEKLYNLRNCTSALSWLFDKFFNINKILKAIQNDNKKQLFIDIYY